MRPGQLVSTGLGYGRSQVEERDAAFVLKKKKLYAATYTPVCASTWLYPSM